MKRSKLILFAAALALTAVLAGCGGKGGDNPTPAKNFTVTFNSNGGSTIDPQPVAEGSTLQEPVAPTKTGYTFAGWFTDDGTLANRVTFPYTVTADITLYAKWMTGAHTVTFSTWGLATVDPQVVADGGKATEPVVPTMKAYYNGWKLIDCTVAGWYTDSDSTFVNRWDFVTRTVTSDVTLYAKLEWIPYIVTFESNGGSTVASQPVDEGSTIAAPSAPTRTGYTFGGWFTDVALTTSAVFPLTVTADITLYAKWLKNYTVIFNSNGGSTVASQTVADGKQATQPTPPTKSGYVFAGWFTDAMLTTAAISPIIVNSDITLYAKWILITAIANQGATINGVNWAGCNVDAAGTFATNPQAYGMFYQWNRKTAWPATGTVTGWDSTYPSGDTWDAANDPCPAGWRVPTSAEQVTLLNTANVTYAWTTLNGVNGCIFTDKTSGASIFFPAAGYRIGSGGRLSDAGYDGNYWSSSPVPSNFAWILSFSSSRAYQSNLYRTYGYSVRCVRQ